MKDLKFEQKGSLSRSEAAELLSALAAALMSGGDVELELGSGVLSMYVPDELRSEVEVEVGEGEVELEIELKWPTAQAAAAAVPKSKSKSKSRSVETRSPSGDQESTEKR
ncbi:amphi-Trp domain-containing protein [Embleya sp. NPDC005971]|uniref:amphi-Trp domain-containing protein n=1 Tax=Embleya sp. NPDC005971 TaxID=3156724 RepID=UPI0033EE3B92